MSSVSSAAQVPKLDVDIHLGVLIRAEPERVWEALTTTEGVNQ